MRTLWESIADSAPFMPDGLGVGIIGEALTGVSFAFGRQLNLLQHFSPSQINPFNLNPLRNLLSNQVDFERLQAESKIKLFIAATHVRSGTS